MNDKKLFLVIPLVLALTACLTSDESSKTKKNRSFIDIPFVPENIAWEHLDSLNKYEDQYSSFKTVYFPNDSIVFIFSAVNNKKLICIDTSVLDTQDNVYNDTSFCHYEDSIGFGVENLEMSKWSFLVHNNKMTLKPTNGGEVQRRSNDSSSEIFDSVEVNNTNHVVSFRFENKRYVPIKTFKKAGLKRLIELTRSNFQ